MGGGADGPAARGPSAAGRARARRGGEDGEGRGARHARSRTDHTTDARGRPQHCEKTAGSGASTLRPGSAIRPPLGFSIPTAAAAALPSRTGRTACAAGPHDRPRPDRRVRTHSKNALKLAAPGRECGRAGRRRCACGRAGRRRRRCRCKRQRGCGYWRDQDAPSHETVRRSVSGAAVEESTGAPVSNTSRCWNTMVRIGRIRPRVPNIRGVLGDRESCATQEINEIKAAGAGPHPQGQGVYRTARAAGRQRRPAAPPRPQD